MHLDQPTGQVQLFQVEAGQFRQAQARGVEQFEDGLVAPGDEVVVDATVEQLQGAVGIQGLGQAALTLRWRQAVGRVVLAHPFAIEIAVQAAYRREQPCQAARGLAMVVLAGHQLAQLLDLQRVPAGDALVVAEFDDFLEVAAVGQQGVPGYLALVAQVGAISFQLALHQRTERSVWVKRGSTRPSTSAM